MQTLTKPELQAADRLNQTVAALARLLDQTTKDIQILNAEVEERVMQAAQETGAAMEQQMRFDQERSQLSQDLNRMKQAAAEWDTERARLMADCQRASQLLEQSRHEHDLALAETDEAAAIALERQIATAVDRVRIELTTRWDAERAHLVGERNRAQQRLADAAAEYERQLADATSSLNSKLTEERDQLRRELEQARQTGINVQSMNTEVTRVEGLIQEIAQVLDNPETELSIVIRKHAERGELESYLRGVRFGLRM